MENQTDPLYRFLAMAGLAKDLCEAAIAQAAEDRAEYGDEYVAGVGREFAMAVLAVRFLHEVCAVPYAAARERIVGVLRTGNWFRFDRIPCPSELVGAFMTENGNVFLAVAAIEMFVEATEGTPWKDYWEHVLHVMCTATPIAITLDRPDDATLH